MVYHYSPKLLASACLYCKNKADAEDVLQDAYVIVFKKINQFEGDSEGQLYAWIKKITINLALNKYRLNYYKKEVHLENQIEIVKEPDVFSQLEMQEVLKLVKEMPIGYRRIFSLFVFESKPHKEIAELLKIKTSTSRSQYIRAKRWLVDRYDKLNVDPKSKKDYEKFI